MNILKFPLKISIILPLLFLLLASCASRKKIVYLNDGSFTDGGYAVYQNTLQPDDNLLILVTADEPELAAPFNLMYNNMQSNDLNNINASNDAMTSYLINQDGEIDLAGVGKVKLAGLTRIEAENKIKSLLEKQISNPVVILRILNFKVTVNGEVAKPGVVTIPGERITIFEALGMTGDITIYGKRDNVMLIREVNGVKTVNYLNLTDPAVVNSPYYYLQHNDLIYVEPNKTRVNSSVIGPNLTVGISALSLIVTIIALSTR